MNIATGTIRYKTTVLVFGLIAFNIFSLLPAVGSQMEVPTPGSSRYDTRPLCPLPQAERPHVFMTLLLEQLLYLSSSLPKTGVFPVFIPELIVLLVCLLCICRYILRCDFTVHHALQIGIQNVPNSVCDVGIIDLARLCINIGIVVEVLSDLVKLGKVNIANLGQSDKCIILCT